MRNVRIAVLAAVSFMLACTAPIGAPAGPDDCSNNQRFCSIDAACVATATGFECECLPGWTGDGEACGDVNECHQPNRCGRGTRCVNLPGTYRCVGLATSDDESTEVTPPPCPPVR